jgi:hypothetical protein
VQYHGVSAFKNAIRDAFDIDQILEFTKLNIKWRSSQLPTSTPRPGGRAGRSSAISGLAGKAAAAPAPRRRAARRGR